MMPLAEIINTYAAQFLREYGERLGPEHRRALSAMGFCRRDGAVRMHLQCQDCAHQAFLPHSCGHRHCPHCQHHESQRWIERQMRCQLPGDWFLITFTLPAEFRGLAFAHQRTVYDLLLTCAWQTVERFAHNDRQLHGAAGAIAVLHTHTRRLDYHPHVHLLMPAGALDTHARRWRTKRRGKDGTRYLFSHKALA
ncbi:MAG: transposase zinc-binding domain-containing protein, partial [Rhodocyclaceae bacterium]|nr:transposase zinc-binding domain-containing protein [Rhodocyclaceae bacterium]